MSEVSERRSAIMRAVRSRDTTPELTVRRLLHKHGYRYRLHCKDLAGKPDIVFRKRRKAIFVHGCFWHGHDCPRGARIPKSNRSYWTEKVRRNQQRDQKNAAALDAAGWSVLAVWECETRDLDVLTARLQRFLG